MPKGVSEYHQNPKNQLKPGNKVAQKYTDENLTPLVEEYIDFVEEHDRHPNIAGFSLFAKISMLYVRKLIEKNTDWMCFWILLAYIENYNVQGLRRYPAGSFIHLKQKYWEWVDQQIPKAPAVQNIQINIAGSSKEAKAIKQGKKSKLLPKTIKIPVENGSND